VRTIGRTAQLGALALSFWTFSDVFEEITHPETKPFHDGYGLLTIDNIRKPAFRAFELLSQAGRWMLPVNNTIETENACDVWSTLSMGNAAATTTTLNLFVSSFMPVSTNREVHNTPSCEAQIFVTIDEETTVKSATVTRIDSSHANAFTAWKELDRPNPLSSQDKDILNSASELLAEDASSFFTMNSGILTGVVKVPPFGVALVLIELADQ